MAPDLSSSFLQRQHDVGGMGGVVVKGMVGEVVALLQAQGAVGVGVDVKPRLLCCCIRSVMS